MPWTAASTHPGFHGMLSTPASNLQARMRTSLLMNKGFVIGTGDVSELALGWCTYNGDHMSMYNPNVSLNCEARIAFLRDTLIG